MENPSTNDSILFHYELESFLLDQEEDYQHWIMTLCKNHGLDPMFINYIFTDDEYILQINKDYLKHDFYTDIITFPISSDPLCVDIYISVERVEENAKEYNVDKEEELKRVMAHGILHIAGFKDKEEEDIKKMREQEDVAIGLFKKGN